MRDWLAIAAALKIELGDGSRRTLETLDKTMLGLRGLIDWGEEPAVSVPVLDSGDDAPKPGPAAGGPAA
jgi:hypothetical protein